MLLSLEAAAKHANVTVEDVFSYISSGKLKAKAATEDGVVNYAIEIKDLDNFLAGGVKEADTDFEDDFLGESLEKKSSSPVIRRLLTAEAVSDLRVQTQVLASRVDTLERLFSEFIDLEKNESTLVLENSWKLSDERKENENQIVGSGENAGSEQITDGIENQEVEANRDERTELTNVGGSFREDTPDRFTEDVKALEVQDSASMLSEEEQSKNRRVKIEQNIQQKEKAAEDAKAKLLNKTPLVKEIDSSEQIVSEGTAYKGQTDKPESVSDRLAQYEIKLARAKQAAHQLWH